LETARAEQLLHRNVQRFRGGLVFKAHRLLCHSALGLRVIKKKKKKKTARSWMKASVVRGAGCNRCHDARFPRFTPTISVLAMVEFGLALTFVRSGRASSGKK